MVKETAPTTAARIAIGDIVAFREMHNPADESTLHYVPAIVREVRGDGSAALTIFGHAGKRQFTQIACYSAENEWMTWQTLPEYLAANTLDDDYRFASPGQADGVRQSGINLGSIVHVLLLKVASDSRGGAMGLDARPLSAVGIVRGIDADGRLAISAFTEDGVHDVGSLQFHRYLSNCWCKNSTGIFGSIVLYRKPIDTGRPEIDAIDNAAGLAPLIPAIVCGMSGDDGSLTLLAFSDNGAETIANCKSHPTDAGCYVTR